MNRNSFVGLIFGLLLLGSLSCGPSYPKCDNDDHCSEKNEVCVDGTCQQCREDTQCKSDQTCRGGRCVAKSTCATDSDCPNNQVCLSGQCKQECATRSDCGSGLKCVDNRCVDELSCNRSSDCVKGMSCVSGQCTDAAGMRGMGCDYPAVQFPFNEATLSQSVKNGLSEVASCMKEKGGTIVIEGHCDERGTEEYNLALGDRRARAVKSYLSKLGVEAAKLRVVSKGETQPKNSASTEEAWAENRRAEFVEQ